MRASRSVQIRRLRPSDYHRVVALLAAVKMNPHTRGRESPTAFAHQLRAHPATYLGAFDGDRLVGVMFGTHDVRKGWINRLAVHSDDRRQKIGSRLARECERPFRRQGLETFAAIIEVDNRASASLFRSMGYNTWKVVYARKKRRPDV